MEEIPRKFANGAEFFRLSGSKPLDVGGYFVCIDELRPLFEDSDFKKATPGFYLNSRTSPDDNGLSLRLVYYSLDPTKTQECIRKFVNENKSKISPFDSRESSRPTSLPPDVLDEENFRFFSFLNMNTQIFLDVSQNYGIEPLRVLIADYLNIFLPKRIAPEKAFELVFIEHSDYFRQLKDANLDKQYWIDFTHVFHKQSSDPHPTLHFLANLSLVDDRRRLDCLFQDDWILR